MEKKIWQAACSGAALLFATGVAGAQTSNFGSGCAGASGSAPTIGATGQPVTGQAFSLDVSGLANSAGLLLAGASNTSSVLGPLPAALDLLGLPGCFLNVSNDVLLPFGLDGNGDVSFNLVGFNPGVTAYAQALVIDPDATFTTIAGLSDGLSVTGVAPSGFTGGEIIITEFMKNPTAVGDNEGEYVEIHNTTAGDIDIEGWTLGDDDFDGTVIDNGGAGVVVTAGGYLLLGADGDSSLNGNLNVDYDYNAPGNGQFFLSNSSSGDEIALTDHTGVQIDHIAYDSAWPNTAGVSAELSASALDGIANDDPANWASSVCTIAGGPICNDDLGTPGSANDQCVTSPCVTAGTSGELIFSEIMQNPSSVSDSSGEWFEVYNTTASDIDMLGYTIAAGGSPNQEVISSSVIVPAGGYALFARKSDPAVNGNLPTPAYDYVDGLNFSNSSQDCKILDTAGGTVCEVSYDNGSTYPDGNGASMNLSADKLTEPDAVVGANWCLGTQSYGDGDLGTPGTANDVCP